MIVCQREPGAPRRPHLCVCVALALLLMCPVGLFHARAAAFPAAGVWVPLLFPGADEKASTGLDSPAPLQTFAGISPANSTPPDSHGAVGPNHVMTQVNGQSVVRDRNGTLLASVGLTSFWSGLGISDVFDPKVLYDPHSNRFITVACAQRRSSASGMLFGVSATADPTGTWHLWLLDADASNVNWVDFPSIGLTASRITFSGNLFSNAADAFNGVNIWTIDKASALDGGALTMQLMKLTGVGGTLVPAFTHDAGETTQYIVRSGTSNLFNTGRLQVYSLSGAIGSLTFAQAAFASLGPAWSISLPNAKQLGSAATIETNDDRIMNAVVRNGRLWASHTVAFNTVTRDHTAAKWWEINPVTGETVQTGLIEDVDAEGNFDNATGRYYYYPTIAVNSDNDVLVGFTGSSALEFPSAYYAYRASTAGPSLFNEPLKYKDGTGTYSGPRWGDYSHTVVDPVDDTSFWTVQQIAIGSNQTANFWAKVGEAAGGDVTLPRVSGATSLTSTTVRVTFDESMTDNAALVNPANYTFTGGLVASGAVRLNTTQVSVTVNEMQNGQSYTLTVNTAGPTDLAGNTVNPTGNTAVFSGLGSSPTATISLDNPSPTNLNTVAFSVDFNESVGATFTAADVTVTGSLATGAAIAVSGGPLAYTVQVTPTNPSGEGTIGIAVGTGITDLVGNAFGGASSPSSYTLDNTAPAIGVNTLLTTDSTPPLTGTVNDNGASISVSVGGQTRAATNNGNGTWTLANNSLSPLADGVYSVVATATDPAGNSAADGTSNELTIDATPPSITVNSRVTNDNTPQLTGAVSEPGAAVTVVVGGQTRSATNNGNGTWTLPDGSLTPLSDGAYNVVATAADAVGNMGTDGTSNELTVDTVAPALTVNTLVTNDTRPPLTGTTSDTASAISVSVGGQTRTATNNGNGTWSVADNSLNALAAGVYNVIVTSTDAAGNAGSDSTSNELTIDTTPPSITVNTLRTNDTTPPLTGTVTDMGASISVTVGGQTRTATNNGNGTWTLANNALTTLAQGTYSVTATATDVAGNSASDSTTNELVIDTTAPAVTVNPLATSDTTPPLSGTVNDATAVISLTVAGQTRTATNNGTTWSLANGALSTITPGTYNVIVTATDQAGNAGSDSTTNELTIDTTAPTVTVSTLTSSDSTPALGGTVSEPAAVVRVTVGAQSNLTATNNGNGTWTLPNNTLVALSDGVYNVAVTATDAAGNTGSDTTTNELRIDTLAPAITVASRVTNDSTPSLNGTVNDNSATISISVGGQTRAATNVGNGTWTLTDNLISPALVNGVYNVVATATDAAGNAGVDATTNELTVDTLAPAITVAARTTNDTTPSLTGTVNDSSASISITVGGQTRAATNNGNGTWTLADGALSALAAGVYNVAATATDPAGNAGVDATSNELTVDVTAPSITVNALTTNDNTPPLSGTVNDSTSAISITVGGQTRTATNNGNGTWSLANGALSALGNGTFNVVASATDLAGNTGVDGSSNELVIDTITPSITVSTLATTDSTPPLGGTVSETGATITVSVGGQTRAATNNGNGTWTLANNLINPALTNGSYNVTATASDAAGNTGSDTTTNELTVDTIAPVITVTTLVSNDQRPVLTGTVNDNLAVVRVSVGGQLNLVATNNANGSWTLPDTAYSGDLAPGTYDVAASATDPLGNVGNDATTNELVIDLTIPDIVITVTPVVTNDTTPPMAGTVGDNAATIELLIDGATYLATNNADGTWMLPDNVIAPLAEGVYSVAATATNGALSSTDTSNNELTIDITPPSITVTPLSTQDTTPTLTGTTNTPNATIRVDVGGQNDLAATNNGNGTWTLNVPGALPQNTYNVVARATDTAGNIGTDTTVSELRVDVTPPAITVASLLTSNNQPGLSGTIVDTPAGGTVTVSITVNGQTRAATVSAGNWAVASGAFSAIPDGTYNVQAAATDQAGNVGNDATAGELTVDTTPPTVSVNALNTNDRTPQLTGSVNDNSALIRVSVAGQNNILATNNANGTWTLANNTLASLADGTYNVSVTATDQVGNAGSDATTDELRVDATAPAIALSPRTTNDSTPALTGTVNDSTASIAVTVSGNTFAGTNNGNGTWTLADNVIVPPLASGTYSVAARATDGFGNIGTDPTSSELVVDLQAPVIAVNTLLTNDDTPPLNGTVDDPSAAVTVSVGSQLDIPATNNGNGTWSLPDGTLNPLADGVYNVIARATDAAGNTGLDGTNGELTINSQAPAITVDVLATTDSTPALAGTIDDPAATVTIAVGGQTGLVATNNGDGTWTLADNTLTPLADGVYNVAAEARDAQNNLSMDGTTSELLIDTMPPLVSVDALLTNDNRPPLSGTVTDPMAIVRVAVNGETNLPATNNGNGTWSLPDNTIAGALPDNDTGYDVVVTATDSVGNAGTDTTTGELRIDTAAPVLAINMVVTGQASPGISGTIDDNFAQISVSIDGQTLPATNNSNGTWTLAAGALAPLATGTYAINAEATDAAGNVGSASLPGGLSVDLTPPAVAVNTLITTDTTPMLTGTVDDTAAVVAVTVAGQTNTATNNGNGTWTLADNTLTALPDGVYDVEATATDSLGNVGVELTSNELTVDTSGPAVTVDFLITNDTTPALSGTIDEVGVAIAVTVQGNTYNATNNGDGTWTVADGLIAPALTAGVYDVMAVATDGLGNTGSDGSTDELTIDLIPPVVSVDTTLTTLSSPNLGGTVDDIFAAISVTVGGQTRTATNIGNGTWALVAGVLDPLASGVYDVAVTAIDLAGNASTDATVDELTVDLDAPVVTVDELITNDNTPPLSGTVDDSAATLTVTVAGQVMSATNNADGTWGIADNTVAPLADGAYNVLVEATDPAGNVATDPTPADDLFIITEAPEITVVPSVTSDTTPQINGFVNQTTSTITITVDGQVHVAENNGDGTWTLPDGTLESLADGTYDVDARATDLLGNIGADATTDELVIDQDAPIITVTPLSTRDRTPALSGTVSVPGVEITVSVGGQTHEAINNGDGTWSLADDTLGELADGVYDVVAVARGVVDGTDATINELTIDTLGPALVVSGPSAQATQIGPVSFNLHYGEGAQVGLLPSDVETFALLEANVTEVLKSRANGEKSFPISTATATGTVSVSGTGDQVRTVTVTDITGDGFLGIAIIGGSAVDAAGNPAPSAIAVDLVQVDNTAPEIQSAGVANLGILTITFNEPMGDSALNPENYTISGPGQGTLAPNPDLVVRMAPDRYRLIWSTGASVNGQSITITVLNATDAVTNLIGENNTITVLVEGIGEAPSVTGVEVTGARSVLVRFSEPIDIGALDESNYAISGSGRGTLAVNPDSIAELPLADPENPEITFPENRNSYRLAWDGGEMRQGGDITVTVSGVLDNSGDGIGSPASATDAGAGIGTAPTVSAADVITGLTVETTFSEAMGAEALDPANYAISGAGRGTLAMNPDAVAIVTAGKYLLTWNAGEMVNGRDITITAANVFDEAGNPLGTPDSATDPKAGRDGLITVTIPARRDVTLYEDAAGELANGAGPSLFAGRSVGGLTRRGLLFFDVPGNIPAGSTVLDADLVLVSAGTAGDASPAAVRLMRATSDWSEGDSGADDTGSDGVPAAEGDATWLHAIFDTVLWANPGGDFDADARATTSVGGAGTYVWAAPEVIADTQSWLDNPDTNFGWLLMGDESTDGTVKQFFTEEHATAAQRPQLQVVYSLNGGPGGPVLGSIGDQSVEEGETLTLNLTAVDTGNNPLAITPALASLPPGHGAILTDNGDGTAQFTWTPTFVDSGSYVVTFIATQLDVADPLSISETIVIDVIERNQTPAFEDPGVLEATEGVLFTFDPVLTDADAGDTHTYSLLVPPGDAAIDPQTGQFTWTPGFSTAGNFSIGLVAVDNGTPPASVTLQLQITVADANGPPALSTIGDQLVVEGDTLSFLVQATDPDLADTLTFSLEDAPAGSAIEPATGQFTWTPTIVTAGDYEVTFVVADDGTPPLSARETVTITVVDNNQPPTDIRLTPGNLAENMAAGTTAGTLTTVDADAGDVHVYSLVAGAGDSDNGLFTIAGSSVLSSVPFNFETRATYSIRVQTFDGKDGVFARPLTISVINVNEAPQSIALSASSVTENVPAGTVAGTFTTTDEDVSSVHTYALVEGAGDTGNGLFSVSGNNLVTVGPIDFEVKPSLNIRVRSTDAGGASVEATFTLDVINENDTPDSVSLSNDSVEENRPAGTLVGEFMTDDADGGDTHSYTLVAGEGSTDNAQFRIEGNTLLTAASLDFERGRFRQIRVRTSDGARLNFEMMFQIEVVDVNDAPTDITISAAGILNNVPADTKVGDLFTADQDLADSHVYVLAAGDGAQNNNRFKIVDRALFTAQRVNFDSNAEFNVRIRTTDTAGAAFEKAFVLTNDDVDGDGLSDVWEQANFGNLQMGATDDPDGDTLTNLEEFQSGTNPANADSDGDGVSDGVEVSLGSDPNNLADAPAVLRVSPASLSLGRDEGMLTLNVTNAGIAPMNWDAQLASGGEFVSIVTGQSGVNSGQIVLMVNANSDASPRAAAIRITASNADGSPLVIPLSQSACAIPGTPEDVLATNGTLPGQVRVTWDAVAGADRYMIYRGIESDPAAASLIATVTGTAYTDSSAPPLDATKQDEATGCVLLPLPTPDADAYLYWVRATSVCGTSAFSQPNDGFPGPGNPPARELFEPVVPLLETENRTLTARPDTPLAIRLRRTTAIDPASISGLVEFAGGSSTEIGWLAIDTVGLTDGWAIFSPADGEFVPGDTVSFTVSASTVAGESIGPLNFSFTIESEEAFLGRIGADGAPIPQPAYTDFDASQLDLSREGNDLVSVYAVPADRLPALPADALGSAYVITPDEVYGLRQRVWIPIEGEVDPGDVQVNYYFADKTGTQTGWHAAAAIRGWAVEDSFQTLELDGTRYIGFLVRHGGLVQLSTVRSKLEVPASAALIALPEAVQRHGGDAIILGCVLLGLMRVLVPVAGMKRGGRET